MWLYGGYCDVTVVFQLFIPELILRVGWNVEPRILEQVVIECGDVDFPVDAFWDARHLGVAVPIEFVAIWDQDKEKREFGLYLDGQGNDGMWLS